MQSHDRSARRDAARDRLRPFVERSRAFTGWEFHDIALRNLDPPPLWDFGRVVDAQAGGRRSVLDLGTGGGEWLSSLRPFLPSNVVATEEWSKNAPIAFRVLSPLGVRLVRAKSVCLPFRNRSFDLVIDRHEAFEPTEVDRVLMRGGCFVTQQVGRHDWKELRRYFPRMTDFGDQRSEYSNALADRGFAVESSEHDARVAYASLGDFVFMLCISPWTIPEFSVETDLDSLLAFESECLTEDGLVVTECRYLIVARKTD